MITCRQEKGDGEERLSVPTEEEKTKNIFRKGEEFIALYRKVEGFTRELLQDNEKLRFRLAALEQENKSLRERSGRQPEVNLVEQVKRLEAEKEELLERYRAVERENVDFAKRYVEIETENNNLANLYVASFQLHSTLDFREVLQIVKEIIINLIGAEAFAVYLIDQKKGELSAVTTEGLMEAMPPVKTGEGIIGSSVTGEQGVYVAADPPAAPDLDRPMVVIPLRIKAESIGAIAIYGLLEQKKDFTPLDVELFNLLGGHAATALFGAKLYSESRRKLTTIQGFLELLKPE